MKFSQILFMLQMACFLNFHVQSADTPLIMVDQFGYRPRDGKIAVIANPQAGFNASVEFIPGAEYQVRRAGTEDVVFAGTPEVWRNGATHTQSGDKGWWFDFSDVTAEGTYYVFDVENNVASYTFDIHENVYAEVLKAALRMYYYNRCGMTKEAQYAGECWADDISFAGNHQDTEARDVNDKNNPETAKDMSGGWFDAGDFNKYVTFVDHVIHQLLDAYMQNPVAWTDDVNIPESGNGIPDILDEVIWEIEWLKKMQDTEDGGVHIKMGSITYNLGSPPSSDRAPRYYGPKCSSSSIATAGMFAHTAIVLSQFAALKDDALELRERAILAWNWYHNNPKSETCDTQEIKSGDADVSVDAQQEIAVTAAVYLFALTGESIYNEYVIDHYKEVDNLGWWGPYRMDRGDALLYYTASAGANSAVANDILAKLRNAGQSLGDFYKQDDRDLYRAHMPDAQYHWGSNAVKANTGNLNMNLITYDQDTANHSSYEEKALSCLHYMHGVNSLNLVYLSNMYDYGAAGRFSIAA
ncbi:glycoside hydrolase family 9 protein [candidate division KSB1 bacterium]|nr:glycoside hydrolase family 9 protein [candidate division KSB1 bacterium]